MLKRNKGAFSMSEILIVLAIMGIVAGISFVSGRQLLNRRDENAVVNSLKQSILEGATAASSRGVDIVLFKDGQRFSLFRPDTNEEIYHFDIPATVQLNLPDRGEVLSFAPQGWVDEASLALFPKPLLIQTTDKTYNLSVSLIGEVKVEVN